nr:hypothetical protein [Tanacetum cinerariifolium]
MSFANNGLELNIRTTDFHNNESNHQNEFHFEKPECSFTFRDYHEYEDEKNEFDDVVDDKPLPNYQKWKKYMSFKPETPLYKSKPRISKDYKKEIDVKVGKNFDNKEALDLAIRLKALDEGYQFLNDRSAPERHAAIALAVQDEFPLAYHDKDASVKVSRDLSSNGARVDHPLMDYGKYALGCMTGADMKKCVHLKSVRDELLRSIEEKTVDGKLQRHVV